MTTTRAAVTERCPRCAESVVFDPEGFCPSCLFDKSDRRERDVASGAQASTASLHIEGGQRVLAGGQWVDRVPFDRDEIVFGRRDAFAGHYPDVDLLLYRFGDPYIARRHVRFFRREGEHFVEDLARNDATHLNDAILNGETAPLRTGDRVVISQSIAVVFEKRE